ncbi:MAG: peptidoglycan DD-metalloendopeptidase family protein, partial [Actinobacteria bacterium]|nr:peptidoglycan DD-metalloendopeptidase family protein [Actinomycetota bacterium]
ASNEALRLGQELDKTTAQRQETERQLAEVQAELDKTLRQLEEAKKQLARYKSILNDRLKNVYKNGKSNYIEVIFQSADFNDLINRVSFLKLIASQDSRLVVKTQEVKLTVEAREAEQERQKNSIEVKRAAIVAEEERIAFLKAEQDRQKAAAGAERNQREALVVQLKQDQAALEEMERQEEADAAALAARIRSWGRIVVSRTGWVWPTGTPADITSPFGPRTAPTSGASTFHQGVDIAVDYGTPIVAANNGVVEDASWFGGYGLYIGINHGDGVASAYGHLSAVAVEPGETVKAGQVIGYVGSTGISTGPHLHFEILVDGVQQNPMNWY